MTTARGGTARATVTQQERGRGCGPGRDARRSTGAALLLAATLGAATLGTAALITGCDDGGNGDAPGDDASRDVNRRDYPLDDVLRFNEIVMRCTHNSYHIAPAFPFDASHEYTHDPLDVQLGEHGVRAFELDIHFGAEFPVLHIPIIDPLTTCATLGECLETIAGWSELNPDHHMIVVWIEIKDELSNGTITDYDALDGVIRGSIGEERIYTPDDFQRGYESPRAALEAEGWPTLGETRGRVMFVLLDVDEPHSPGYTSNFTTLEGRAMFARATRSQYGMPWAVVAKINNPSDGESIAEALEAGMLVASNVGGAASSDESNAAKLADGLRNGSHMLCDDFPAPVEGREYVLDIPGGVPSACNAVTASASCVAEEIEQL